MQVVIVDEELPFPLNSGKRIRSFQLVSRLARRHQVTYICHRNADPTEAHQAEAHFCELGIETIVVENAVPSKSGIGFYARLAANLASPLPYSVATHTSPALVQAIHEFASGRKVDLWQAEWTPYAESLRSLGSDARLLIMAHNVESQIWRRYYENETDPLRRWYIGLQWRKFERFERRVFHKADRIVAVSPEDSILIRDHVDASRVDLVENGVDTDYFQPGGSERVAGQFLFLGSLDWRPNLDAVEQLLNVIFPAVLAHQPSAQLCIVGRNPPESLRQRVAATPCVELHADVPDVRQFLARADLMLVPLRIGGGSRLKILEALAMKTPVLSTRLGAEGLDVQDGQHLALIESCGEMAQSILHHAQDRDKASMMADRGRTRVEDRYEWDILADHLERIWNDVVTPNRSERVHA